jgi:predicted PurR-regulated permease PerM
VGKVFLVAVLIDVVYEIVVFRWVYPLQPFLVAIVLAVIPYLLIRGPVNRLARRRRPRVTAKKRDAA